MKRRQWLLVAFWICGLASPAVADEPPSTVRVAGIVLKWVRGDKEVNFRRVEPMIREAAKNGARMVCTTECFLDGYAIADKSIPLDVYRHLGEKVPDGPYCQFLAGLAKELKIHLVAGMTEADGEARYNTAVLFGPDGKLVGKYHKQKLGHESERNKAGEVSAVFETPFGKTGLMICADRTDPMIVRRFCDGGAGFLLCPSGGMFGPKSNDPILQARSKENAVHIVFVHPAEFLVTAPDGSILERTILGDNLLVSKDQIGGDKDPKRIFYVDLPTGGKGGRADDKPPRGYSIPLLDLAAQKDRQVIVDREAGQYLGHPTTVLMEDGKTIITVYPKGHGKGAIVMKRSSDGGKTWSERLPTPKSWETSLETPTLYRVVDSKGVKRLIVFSGHYPIRVAISEDDGKTWSELKPIGDFGGIVAMSSVARLKNGDYMALFHDDGRFLRAGGKKTDPRKTWVYKTVSKDGGLTWGQPGAIAHHPEAYLVEPGLIHSPDGKQIAVLLRESSRKFNSFVIFSDDEGETWSKPRELPGALTGDRHVGKYAPDGRLFITFRDTTLESPTKGDWVAWVGTYDDIVRGREGQYRVRLMKNHKGYDCAYPGLELLPDGSFVTTTYGHWVDGEMPFIVSIRLTMKELDAVAAKAKGP